MSDSSVDICESGTPDPDQVITTTKSGDGDGGTHSPGNVLEQRTSGGWRNPVADD